MHIGDLPQSQLSVRLPGSAAFQVMLVLLAFGFLALGWLTWPSSRDAVNTSPKVAVAAPKLSVTAATAPTNPASQLAVPAPAPSHAAAPVLPSQTPTGSVTASSRTGTERVLVASALPAGAVPDTPPLAAIPPPSTTPSPSPSAAPAPPAPRASSQDALRTANADARPITAPAPAAGLVDLNTASVDQLNALQGAGSIGRAIVRGRPYASTDDLVTRRVLRRSVYEQIKDQVTVR